MSNSIVINIRELSKVTKRKQRLKRVSLQVAQGECFGLCGGNGAGKSTLIKILTGQSNPTTGEITLFDCSLEKNGTKYKRLFSYMADDTSFPSMLTGYEVLSFFARLQQISAERVLEMLKVVGLEKAANERTKTYSKGMRQRLALAQALLPSAPILILDEPTNGLDPYWAYEFKEIIRSEKERGTTIFYTSHILADVEQVADKVGFLHEGQLLSIIRPIDVVNDGGLEEYFFQLIYNRKASSLSS